MSSAAAAAVQSEPAPVVQHSRPVFTQSVLLGGAGAVLLLAPLAFGAVEPWSIFALEACAILLMAAWGARQWINDLHRRTQHRARRTSGSSTAKQFGEIAGSHQIRRHRAH